MAEEKETGMKKFKIIRMCLLSTLLSCMLFGTSAFAAESKNVQINKTNFPDKCFREYVRLFDVDEDESLSPKELERVTVIRITPEDEIFEDYILTGIECDLKGIENFTSLQKITIKGVSIKEIKLKYFPKLRRFVYSVDEDATNKTLDFSKNSRLESALIKSKAVTKILFPNISNLKEVSLYDAKISKLDLKNNTTIEKLLIARTKFREVDETTLKISPKAKLNSFIIQGCDSLRKIDVSHLKNLENLTVQYAKNEVQQIKIGKNLKKLTFSNATGMKQMDAKTLIAPEDSLLEGINCKDSKLVSYDLRHLKNIRYVYLNNDTAQKVDITGCKKMQGLGLYGKQFQELYCKDTPSLRTVYCSSNNKNQLVCDKEIEIVKY